MSDAPIGLIIITRHGDRQGFYQDPTSYTASNTVITPLGEVQEYQSGTGVRARYLTPGGASYMPQISAAVPNINQIDVRADAGGEGGVIVDSAYAFMQGLFPANTTAQSITLANGTTITSPLGGYVYVPVQSVEPTEDYTLEGFTSCPTFASHNTAFYQSPAFLQVQSENEAFLQSLEPVLGPNRTISLANMYNIFDFMNVQNIHNASFAALVTPGTMEHVRDLTNYHEYGVFSDVTPGGVGNIAGQAILAPMLTALTEFQNASSPVRLQYLGVSYKPFLSLFNMTQVPNTDIVDYASVLTYEVRNTSSGYTIRASFRNGTATASDGSDIAPLSMFGNQPGADMPLEQFVANVAPYAINNLTQWCNVCNQTSLNGCDIALEAQAERASASTSSSSGGSGMVSPPVAGVIGAVVALAVAGVLVGLWALWTRTRGRRPVQPMAAAADDASATHSAEMAKKQ
ncbi:phosphoglycerate mutase-like protein [Calocera viscosa TUFC12733]|uniref:Phosphoglycerate mutase-like protein n=1 Tax=Calocera viscosa (strain TUFC12733) TaxID=1330018 RepID=A0A167FP34_CALVF|nr:phosphoglycerate mutase-like protein [Calocera viscosa TUFC12733]KZO90615.1 phosphoglycerate mutase-like protein [Calocera viscosa TUFC12733]